MNFITVKNNQQALWDIREKIEACGLEYITTTGNANFANVYYK